MKTSIAVNVGIADGIRSFHLIANGTTTELTEDDALKLHTDGIAGDPVREALHEALMRCELIPQDRPAAEAIQSGDPKALREALDSGDTIAASAAQAVLDTSSEASAAMAALEA